MRIKTNHKNSVWWIDVCQLFKKDFCLKSQVFWDVMMCLWASHSYVLKVPDLESEGITIPWNIANYSPSHTAPHPRRLVPSPTPLWEPQLCGFLFLVNGGSTVRSVNSHSRQNFPFGFLCHAFMCMWCVFSDNKQGWMMSNATYHLLNGDVKDVQ